VTRVAAELRASVVDRARNRCEYCLYETRTHLWVVETGVQMICPRLILIVVGLIVAGLIPKAFADVEQRDRPNILVILADDLGYGDLGCYGDEDLKTPHMDEFAAKNLRLTDCYSAHPNCSPSRAGMMTGRTPFRIGIYNWIPMSSPMHVKRSEVTIATLLRTAGYDTCHVGKWHLNGWRFFIPTGISAISRG